MQELFQKQIKNLGISDSTYPEIFQISLERPPLYNKNEQSLILFLHSKKPLNFSLYQLITNKYAKKLQVNVKLNVACDLVDITISNLQKYLDEVLYNDLHIDEQILVSIDEKTNSFALLVTNDLQKDKIELALPNIISCLHNYGINVKFSVKLNEIKFEQRTVEVAQSKKYRVNINNYQNVLLKDIQPSRNKIAVSGFVYEVENRDNKSKKTMSQSFILMDDDNAIRCTRLSSTFFPKDYSKNWDYEALELFVNKTGRGKHYITIYGTYLYDDKFLKDHIFNIEELEFTSPLKVEKDSASIPRYELHSHTNMSEMDGVCEPSDIVNQAFAMGLSGITICDHNVVQGFPSAYNAYKAIKKGNPDTNFKVTFGVEGDVARPLINVYQSKDINLSDASYVIFDLETTGLSSDYDKIIEFGAVKLQDGNVIESKQFFINPQRKISSFISGKTNITDMDVKNAPIFEECYQDILDFFGDSILVAHNATFDIGFINESLKRIGQPKLTNPYIDTLAVCRSLYKERTKYSLGAIARSLSITYDDEVAHRADYDADILGNVFVRLLKDLGDISITNLNDLSKFGYQNYFGQANKNHVTIIAKNNAGLKRLFELISLSHTTYLSLLGKVNGKKEGDEIKAEPKIPLDELVNDRDNLLIGSSCLNNEIFELACNRGFDELVESMAFYDYIEIQPLDHYRHLITRHVIPDNERLQLIIEKIIKAANVAGKLVVVSGDVHYASLKQKQYRDVYIFSQGIGGKRHPLYSYNAIDRSNFVSPNQHIQYTDEMKKHFNFLNDEKLVDDIVVNNPLKIVGSIEEVKVIKDELYAPSLDNCDEIFSNICYSNARKQYGDPLPEIVSARLDKELSAIFKGGYGVIYYISHLLCKKSNDDGYLVGSRGSVGSSFVATMSNITEVNPLMPHYYCGKCLYSEFIDDSSIASGLDMPHKVCPKCGEQLYQDGQNIPFETFLGFNCDKTPDIDLNFASDYQSQAHEYLRETLGDKYVYRAGTVGTVAFKTAFGYIKGYFEEKNLPYNLDFANARRYAYNCMGVKRTSGQHPGGIVAIAKGNTVCDFTPYQYPANNPNANWLTTHFDYHSIEENVLKFDILAHVDPMAMHFLHNVTGIDPTTLPLNDSAVISLFSSFDALKIDPTKYSESNGVAGLPEFGTSFVRRILDETKPTKFSELIIISGLSHGTDVWTGNAQELIRDNICTLSEVIGCRDDIMSYLIGKNLPPKTSFDIMEAVRKGKGLKDDWIIEMEKNEVPSWYINSCKKIKYLFPKAHAVAYVIMCLRVGWFKVYQPIHYYASYFSLRCDVYDIMTMIEGLDAINYKLNDINNRLNDRELMKDVSEKEKKLVAIFEVAKEMYLRGFKFGKIDLYLSDATHFKMNPNNPLELIPPFTSLDGLGESVAIKIVEARQNGEFISVEDFKNRTSISKTNISNLEKMHVLDGMPQENQLSLF
ncbi:MAG: PolC-type DNA polymerase III [Erysipelotrichaceae bacterium]